MPPNRISEIVREARSVTADTALRLADHFRTTPEFWMNLQSGHDLSKARAEAPARARPAALQIEGLEPGMAYGLAETAVGREKKASKRELIEPHKGDKRCIRRNAKGEFNEVDDVSRSLAADRRTKAKTVVKAGQGDKGNRATTRSKAKPKR